MRFLILVKASAGSEDGVMPSEQQINDMAAFHEALHQAGKLLDASACSPAPRAGTLITRAARPPSPTAPLPKPGD